MDDKMKSRERVIKAIEREDPDRVPLDLWASYPFMVKLLEHFGYGKEAVHPHLDRKGVMDKIYDKLGIDFRTVMVEPPDEFKAKAIFDPRFHFPWGIKINKDVLKDEWGVTRELNITKTQSRIINYPLRNKSIDEYEFPDPYATGRFDSAQKMMKKWKDYAIIGYLGGDPFFSQAWYLMGFSETIRKMYAEREFISKLFNKMLFFFREVGKQLIEVGSDIIMIADDIGGQNGMLMSPELWRSAIKPYLASLIRDIKKRGVFIMYHSDGVIEPIIPDLIEIGVDILNPIQPECMDPVKIKAKYGDKLTLHGTISIQKTLPYGKTAEVEEEVKERIFKCGYGGGLVISPSNQVLVDTKVKNFIALYETAKKYGKYPLQKYEEV